MFTQFFLTTERLLIKPLAINDDNFILELVNTEGWIKFIGDRKVTSLVEAGTYIENILKNKNISYWVVSLKDSQEKTGVVTFIKRDYLEHHDIGFAFLPGYSKIGYAYESTIAVVNKLIQEQALTHIFATTKPNNISSINLLQKIGLVFEKEMEVDNKILHVYSASTGTLKR